MLTSCRTLFQCILPLLCLGLVTAAHASIHQDDMDELNQQIDELARHLMLQQLFIEERVRSDGNSGVKQIRGTHKGTRSYFGDTFNMGSVLSIHDHTNYDRTVGMGEFISVLNGVEFRTRHNDYKLRMPSTNTSDYHRLEDVPFPEVPPTVKQKHSVADQIKEMREYFRAFHGQNSSIRHDYANYFMPVMCYLEGAWTTDTKTLSEPFHSDRHHIDATSWFDLLEKVRFTSYTGGKSNLENYSFLPTAIIDVKNGTPEYAQWNYRILCHPIRTRLNLGNFGLLDNLGVRMARRWTIEDMHHQRTARFHLNNRYYNAYNETLGAANRLDFEYTQTEILDRIMQEIPGKDNYRGNLKDHSLGQTEYNMLNNGKSELNTAYYHRWSDSKQANIPGDHANYKGFSDENLWVAETNQPRVAPMTAYSCQHNSSVGDITCREFTARYSYAIPLEIIWLTPLYKWNPYDLVFHDNRNIPGANGRTGGTNSSSAFNGTSLNFYYYTPNEFFKSNEVGRDPADTAKDVVGVLDIHGHVRLVKPSGTRIRLPEIDGVGKIRTRYPIAPSHHEGNPIYKEMDALKEMVLDMPKYTEYFEARPFASQNTHVYNGDAFLQHFTTTFAHKNGLHQHDVYVDSREWNGLNHNYPLDVVTSNDNDHQHVLRIQRDPHNHDKFMIVSCDGAPHCWDGHASGLLHMKD